MIPLLRETFNEALITDHHNHTFERWRGSQAGVGKVAGDTLVPFHLVSGNNAYGNPVQVLDVNDTPIRSGMIIYDLHRIIVVAASSNSVYKMRFAYSTTTFADAIAADMYTESMFMISAANFRATPVDQRCERHLSGTKAWIVIWNATNLATLDIFIGVHEYPPEIKLSPVM